MPFVWTVAVRFLREGRIQTLLILVGVALGVAVVTFLTALMSGLQGSLIENTLGSQAHIVVRPPDEVARPLSSTTEDTEIFSLRQQPAQRLRGIDQWQTIMPVIEQYSGVIAVSPMVTGPGLALRGEADRAVAILGIELEQYRNIVDLEPRMVAGELRLKVEDVLIGTDLAEKLGVQLGNRIRLETAGGEGDTFTVRGIFDLGVRDLNLRYIYIGLRQAQALLDLPGGISNIDLRVADIFEAQSIGDRIEASTGLLADSWMETNSELLTALRSQTISTLIIRFFVTLSVALGIASVLVISVVQRSKEIGILRATGTSRGDIARIFLIQGGLVGLIGSIIGVLCAIGLVGLFLHLAPAFPFPIPLSAPLFLGAGVLATITGILSAAAPAVRAARLDPVDAIRG